MPKPTVQIIVRHSADCEDKSKGTGWAKCDCPKSLVVYDPPTKKNIRISCKTRSWAKAEEFKNEYLEETDPLQKELKRLRTIEEQKHMRVEDAVALYLKNMEGNHAAPDTVSGARFLLETSLCEFLKKQPVRPVHIADISSAHLIAWKASWKYAAMTSVTRWSAAKTFFTFCEQQKWIEVSPAYGIKRPKVPKGGHTAIFSDEEFTAIQRAAKNPRTSIFIDLCRWGGMAMHDAVQFRPEMVDAEGVLRYRRHKTGELATVPLPEHVFIALRNVPLEADSVGTEQPFRTKDNIPKSDVRRWQRELDRVFKAAGVKEVKTETGRTRKPHPHMFRDTCAVSALRHGAAIHTVAKMLGHSNITTTQKSYLPFCKELQDATIADARAAQAAAQPKADKGEKVVRMIIR